MPMFTLRLLSLCKLSRPRSNEEIGADTTSPSDIYIADLTEILCKKKRLAPPYTDWVLCLADLTLAIPVDRTVASLEGKNDLALVRTQWAVEHGLKIGARKGGDPSGKSSLYTVNGSTEKLSINLQEAKRAESCSAIRARSSRLCPNLQSKLFGQNQLIF